MATFEDKLGALVRKELESPDASPANMFAALLRHAVAGLEVRSSNIEEFYKCQALAIEYVAAAKFHGDKETHSVQ